MIPLPGKAHDLGGGFIVRRLLPQAGRRAIGPFIFFDYFGPVEFPPGRGIDVRPHPHVGLATITYLFDGGQTHRDNIGSLQEIRPGDVNWMTAGRGIVHSERTGADMRQNGHRLWGIQSWVALPEADEECFPNFQHFPASDLPELHEKDVTLRMIAGTGFGLTSPVRTYSPILYADAKFEAGGSLHYGLEHRERAFLVVEGEVESGGELSGTERHVAGSLLFLYPEEEVTLFAHAPARIMLLGGDPPDGPRHLWWNFVSSRRERIEQAKEDWRENRFGPIPGDDQEFIPLPE